MINALSFFYNININKKSETKEEITFKYQNDIYIFTEFKRNLDEIDDIYILSMQLLHMQIPCHEIIFNKNNKIITYIDQKPYILLKNRVNSNEYISLNDVITFTRKTVHNWKNTRLDRKIWKELWINKIDALEYKIRNHKKNNLYEFYYYQGIVENCIQLLNEINVKDDLISISHKRLTYQTTLNEFYNPLNFIIDHTSRDVAEYLKSKFVIGIDVAYEIKYILNNYSNLYNFQILFCRLLFPSYQLDLFEKIDSNKNNNQLVIKNNSYENNIKKIYDLILSYIYLPNINWLHQ